ncbi:hypothetical protein [Nocardioides litoris]|uniref:hypothetical protein n=1 Tax=Nocardioides litoris TaxID=1926648 RepID=UPI00112291DE|nr:hypothetical protein [Nocardioides litoris]
MERRAFIHLGSPKTGTTHLQNTAWASRDVLAAAGVHLPLARHDHFLLAEALRADDVAPHDLADRPVLRRLADDLAAHPSGDVLLTHELLSHALPSHLDVLLDLLAGFEVHLVLTVRDYQRQVPSEWQQFVKTQHIATYRNFLGRIRDNPDHVFWRGQDYQAVLARWSRGVPAGRVHVVTLPPAGSPPTLLAERFFGLLGVNATTLRAGAAGRSNAMLGFEQAELLRQVNRALPDSLLDQRRRYARLVKDWLAETVLAAQDGTRIVLPRERLDWCREVTERQVRALEAAGYDVVGSLDELLPGDDAPEDLPRPLPDAVLPAAVAALAAAVLQRGEDLDRIAALERRVAELEEAAGGTEAGGGDGDGDGDGARGPRGVLRRLRQR